MKTFRKFISISMAIFMICLVNTTAWAAGTKDTEIPPPHYGEDGPTEDSPYTFQARADEMNPSQQRAVGLVDPFEGRQSRSTVEKLCFISGNDWPIYTTATGSTKAGFVSSRERVWVYDNDDNTNRYYIEYMNYGTLDYGYVGKAAVKIPTANWSQPITTGKVGTDFTSGSHNGIDIVAPAGTTVKAVKSAPHRSRIYTGVVNKVKHLVNFGNYVDAKTDNEQVIYGHLSDFSYGIADTDSPSYRSRYTGTETITTESEFTPSSGEKIGEVGNTGWSTGNHLHFETRNKNNTVKYDPFTFVVFPNVGY